MFALGQMDFEGASALIEVRGTLRKTGPKNQARGLLTAIAKAHGLALSELEEDLRPRHGLGDDGVFSEVLGDCTVFFAATSDEAQVRWKLGKKVTKSPSKAVKTAFPDRSKALVAEGKAFIKTWTQCRTLLETQWTEDIGVGMARLFRREQHPIWRSLMSGLVWDVGGNLAVLVDGELTDVDGAFFTVPSDAEARIWLPAEDDDRQRPWLRRLEALDRRQPFEQLTLRAPPSAGQLESATELLEAVYADRGNDQLRLIYADALMEQGDPRGELIALQLGDKPGSRREKQLQKQYWQSWLGRLEPFVHPKRPVRFERGFLTAMTLCTNKEKPRIPEWTTLKEIESDKLATSLIDLTLDGYLPELRRVYDVMRNFRAFTLKPVPWKGISLTKWGLSRYGSFELEQLLQGFPQLEWLDVVDVGGINPDVVERLGGARVKHVVMAGDPSRPHHQQLLRAARDAGVALEWVTDGRPASRIGRGWTYVFDGTTVTASMGGKLRHGDPVEAIVNVIANLPDWIDAFTITKAPKVDMDRVSEALAARGL